MKGSHKTQTCMPLKPVTIRDCEGVVQFTDEPTGNLDSETSKKVLQLLRETSKKYDQTIIMITHDLEMAKQADRIVKIIDGKIIA